MTTTTTRTRVLPATGITVPADPVLILTGVRTFRAIEGEGFEATVRIGGPQGRVLGRIEQDGNGGGTWLRLADAAGRAEFDAYVEACTALDPDLGFTAHETVCNLLFEEADLLKRLNRKGQVVFRRTTDPWALYEHVYATVRATDGPEVRAHAANQGYDLVWAGGAWQDNA